MRLFEKIFKKRSNLQHRPLLLMCHHKVGTVLMISVFKEVAKEFGLNFKTLHGYRTKIPNDVDIAVLSHSQVALKNLPTDFKAVHLVRDPRDVIVSGYLYHLRTDEKWCVNKDNRVSGDIKFPQVPYSQETRSLEWKKAYLKSLNGQSYQEHLQSLNQHEGLQFEMEHYGAWTLTDMANWNYDNQNILELKFEDIMSSFDQSFDAIFTHLGFTGTARERCNEISQKHDLSRKSVSELSSMKHVSGKETSKWQRYFEEAHKCEFKQRFGDLLIKLGYESDNSW